MAKEKIADKSPLVNFTGSGDTTGSAGSGDTILNSANKTPLLNLSPENIIRGYLKPAGEVVSSI